MLKRFVLFNDFEGKDRLETIETLQGRSLSYCRCCLRDLVQMLGARDAAEHLGMMNPKQSSDHADIS